MLTFDDLPNDMRRAVLIRALARATEDERLARVAGMKDFLLISRGKKVFRIRLGVAPRDYSRDSISVRGRARGKPVWRDAIPKKEYWSRPTTMDGLVFALAERVLTSHEQPVRFYLARDGNVTRMEGTYGWRKSWREFSAVLAALLSP